MTRFSFRSTPRPIVYSICTALFLVSSSVNCATSPKREHTNPKQQLAYPTYSPKLNAALPAAYTEQKFEVQLKVNPQQQAALEQTLKQLGITLQSKIDQDWMLVATTSQLINPTFYQHPAIVYVDLQAQTSIPTPVKTANPLDESAPLGAMVLPVVTAANQTTPVQGKLPDQTQHPVSSSALVGMPMALAMLAQTQQAEGSRQNVTFSPYSVGQAGLAALLGSNNPAQLKRPDWFFGALDTPQSLQALKLPAAPRSLAVYNHLWYAKQHKLQPQFQAAYQQLLSGKTSPLDLRNSARAARTINQKIAQQTQNKITELLSAGDLVKAEAVLTNAVHFKAKWQQPFETFRTQPKPFANADQSNVTVPMMSAKQTLGYAEKDGFILLTLPFNDQQTVLNLILPPAAQSLAVPTLAQLQALQAQSKPTEVVIDLPKLSLQGGKIDLGIWLPDLGTWKLDRLVRGQVLSNLKGIHQATIEWDETGAEAAAATAITDKRSLSASVPQVSFNRPFSFVLQDAQQVLFVGAVRQLPNLAAAPVAVEPIPAQVKAELVNPAVSNPVQGWPQVIVDQIKP